MTLMSYQQQFQFRVFPVCLECLHKKISSHTMSDSEENDGIMIHNDPPGIFEEEVYDFHEDTNVTHILGPIEEEVEKKKAFEIHRREQNKKCTARSKELKELDFGFKLMLLSRDSTQIRDVATIRIQAYRIISSLVTLQRTVRGYLTRREIRRNLEFRKRQQELGSQNKIRRICDVEHSEIEKIRRDNENLRVGLFFFFHRSVF